MGERSFLSGRAQSFAHAFRGLAALFRTQPNARIHAIAAALVIGLAAFFRVSAGEWALLLGCIGFVFAAEAFNTALETLADEVTLERRERIGRAKDLSAAAVLMAAIVSICVGGVIFAPRLWVLIGF